MARSDADVVRRSFELWLGGEVDAWLETLHPDIHWDISSHPLPDVPNRGRGREAFVTDMMGTYMGGWNDYSAELKEISEAGGGVVVVLHETAMMRETGVPLDRELVQLWTVRDGRGFFLRVFHSKAEALAAVDAGGDG